MSKYSDSDDSDDHRKRSKKKKKNRSRSRSKSSERHKGSKHKKSKKSKTSRRSRSGSRTRRSRSASKSRRSRSRSQTRSRRSRSRSRRSPSYDRYSSRYSRRRSRSSSRSRRRSRSRSKSRRRSAERSATTSRHTSNSPAPGISDPVTSIPGFKDLTPAEQNKARLQLALKAAADADQKLKDQGMLPVDKLTSAEQAARQLEIQNIEKEGFVPSTFKSGHSNQQDQKTKLSSHDDAIFGHTDHSDKVASSVIKPFVLKESDFVVHASRLVDPEEKMKKWRVRLAEMRKAKLQGDIL